MVTVSANVDIHELNEIWDDDHRTEPAFAGTEVQRHGTPGSTTLGSAQRDTLATISEPSCEEHETDSSSGIESDQDIAENAERFRQQGSSSPAVQSPYMPMPQPVPAMAIPVSTRSNRGSPNNSSSMQLGTSAPINIPMSANRRFAELEAEDRRFATTFVPPHLMEQKTAEDLSGALTFSGVSPSASIKRERLVHRNAILRSTGFIEGNMRSAGFAETLDSIKESQLPAIGGGGGGMLPLPIAHERPAREASALSKALDTLVGGHAAGDAAAC